MKQKTIRSLSDHRSMDWIYLLLFFLNFSSSSSFKSDDFQCLICDNFLDGPGCGEFTRQLPVRTCQTFCYFAVIHNRSLASSKLRRELALDTYTRAIRDCSPYDDISIDGSLLLQSKIGLSSMNTIEIRTLRRCNSEQCNNEFYLQPDELLFGRSSSQCASFVPRCLFSFVMIFYSSQNIF